MACQYPNCTEHETTQFPNFCIFHAPVSKRDIFPEDLFNGKIHTKIQNNDFNFEGYIFPYFFDFSFKNHYPYLLNLKNAEFHGSKNRTYSFMGASQSNDVCASFNNISFNNGLDLTGCKFIIGAFVFTNAKVNGGQAVFKDAEFHGIVSFENSKFSHCDINFSGSKFIENVSFMHSIVDCKTSEQKNTRTFDFNDAVFNHNVYFNSANIKVKNFQFNNAVFTGNFVVFDNIIVDCDRIEFHDASFECDTFQFQKAKIDSLLFSFNNTKFLSNVSFKESIFNNSRINELSYFAFWDCKFLGDNVSFEKVIFEVALVNFDKSLFACSVSFNESVFKYGTIFTEAKFNSKLSEVEKKYKVNFENVKVESYGILFQQTDFLCDEVALLKLSIIGDITFSMNKFKKGLLFKISDLKLDENSKFKFIDPINHDTDFNFVFIFENIIFNPLKTIFSNIFKNRFLSRDISKDESVEFALIFRACLLNGVNFINNEISNFSFYKSTFEEAVFDNMVLNHRKEKLKYIPYRRNNILFEDYFNTVISKMDIRLAKIEKEKYKLEDSFSFYQVSNMYRTMKKISDNKKDYQRAGDFYFNEFEMERLSNKKVSKLRYIVNSSYKWLAGYGEKPLWCFIWIIIFTTLFSTAHLFLGFSIKEDSFKYLMFNENSSFNLGTYLFDVLMAVVYTLSRVIPLSYFQLEVKSVTSLNVIGLAVSLLNSVVLFVMFAFLFVGLKRQFRRY